MNQEHRSQDAHAMGPRMRWVLVGFLVVGGYFLMLEHKAHLAGALRYLPYLLLLACPLMHLFMHGGHDHGSQGSTKAPNASPEEKE